MQAHERITAAINAATAKGRAALVPFITAGYPQPGDFIATLQAVAVVGDVVELGIPFSDPMADGVTIQRSSFRALQQGVSLKWIFEQLDAAQGKFDAPLVMMSYLNPLLHLAMTRWQSVRWQPVFTASSFPTCRLRKAPSFARRWSIKGSV